jgi:hypothetical protein
MNMKTLVLVQSYMFLKVSHHRPGQGCRRLRHQEFLDSGHMKVVKLSALTPRRYLGYSFVLKGSNEGYSKSVGPEV